MLTTRNHYPLTSNLSTKQKSNWYRPKLVEKFKYQTDLDANKFHEKVETEGNEDFILVGYKRSVKDEYFFNLKLLTIKDLVLNS